MRRILKAGSMTGGAFELAGTIGQPAAGSMTGGAFELRGNFWVAVAWGPLGACCYADGACAVTTATDCAGTWHAEWADCGVADCPQPQGACCFHGGHCEQLSQADCAAAGGAGWTGGAACEPNPCIQRGDLNCDGAVNVFDIDPFVLAIASARQSLKQEI